MPIETRGTWEAVPMSSGRGLPHGKDRKRKVYDLFKPTMHFICDGCFDQLPD